MRPITPTTMESSAPARRERVYDLIEARAASTPAAIAIATPGRAPLTYGRLLARGDAARATLNVLGLGRHDRVALVLSDSPEAAVAFLAVTAAATCAPLNPAYQAAEFDFYLSDLHAKAVIVLPGVDSPARAAARARGIPVIELSPGQDEPAGVFTLAGDTQLPATQRELAMPDDVALVLHTSGTTARPKIVPLTGRNLCASARHIGATLALNANDRCLNVMPLFHIHGLVGALLTSIAAGASVVCTPGFHAPRFFGWIDVFAPTWYTAVPTMHQAIAARAPAHEDIIARRPLRFIRSSSAALPPRLLEELERLFGAPVVEAYGMTEAAHQMASNPLPPQIRKPGSVGPAAGPEVAVMDEEGRLLERGETGELVIHGPNITRGYDNNEGANEKAFTRGWFRTGDQGYLDTDGYVFLTGRLKELINHGGEKIAPREIDEVLLDHPAVAQAVAFAVPHATLGEEVAAAVVVRDGNSTTERALRQFAADQLAPFKVPRRVLIVAEIPKGPTGKLQRIGLAEKLGLPLLNDSADATCDEFVAPRTPLEEALAVIWTQVLGVERVGVHDSFLALGGDSVLAAQILARVHDTIGVDISLIDFFEARTVAGLAVATTERQVTTAGDDELDTLLSELEALTDEDVQGLLAEEARTERQS